MSFTLTFEDADPRAVDRLGGKGAGLARMTQQGLRVPPGYVISTAACRSYLAEGRMPDGLPDELYAELAALEKRSGKTFGAGPLPLLLSVRSGAPVSMPGMMDTILDLGLSRDAAVAIAAATEDSSFMAEIVARFHAMYAETVLGALDLGAAARSTSRASRRRRTCCGWRCGPCRRRCSGSRPGSCSPPSRWTGYVRRGLLAVDPRTAIDPSVEGLLARVAAAADAVPDRRVGLRLTGSVSEAAAAQLFGLGFRRFAVDARETRPFLLSLGKAALG
jgi:Pyruvate phosphate dikinase, AMP/ATP-binding domain